MLESRLWLANLCYLSDIFEYFNALYTLHGKGVSLILFHDKIYPLRIIPAPFYAYGSNPILLSRHYFSHNCCQFHSLFSQIETTFPSLTYGYFPIGRDPYSAPLDATRMMMLKRTREAE